MIAINSQLLGQPVLNYKNIDDTENITSTKNEHRVPEHTENAGEH